MGSTRTEHVRRRLVFSGNVQGVGFRYTARQAAAGYEVTGYVRNLASGEVEVVVEGPPVAIDGFLDRLSARMSGYIDGVEVQESPARGEFGDFDIRH